MKQSNRVSRAWWNLKRFGLTPDKLKARLRSTNTPKVACISIPKSGTHLIERALCLHPNLYRAFVRTLYTRQVDARGGVRVLLERLGPGEVLLLHLKHSERDELAFRQSDTHPIFVYRDPRDIVVSQAHFVAGREKHPLYQAFARLPDLKARIRLAIQGDPALGLDSIGERFERFSGWLESDCFQLRFEDLIGPQGGGRRSEQRRVLKQLFGEVGVEASEPFLDQLSDQVFSKVSPTFRKGGQGKWRGVFDDELKTLFKETAGGELIRYGYESDDNW